jgi:hypothetical protein
VELLCINGKHTVNGKKDTAKYNNHYTIAGTRFDGNCMGGPGLICKGQLPDCCPIIVPKWHLTPIVHLRANFSSPNWLGPCGLAVHSWRTCNDILFEICRMGRVPPNYFLPPSPCPSIYPSPSHHSSIEAFEAAPWILHNVSLIGLFFFSVNASSAANAS